MGELKIGEWRNMLDYIGEGRFSTVFRQVTMDDIEKLEKYKEILNKSNCKIEVMVMNPRPEPNKSIPRG